MKNKLDKLEEFDKKYFFDTKANMERTAQIAQSAQEQYAIAQQAFQGFAMMVQEKYGLENEDRIEADGTITRQKVLIEKPLASAAK